MPLRSLRLHHRETEVILRKLKDYDSLIYRKKPGERIHFYTALPFLFAHACDIFRFKLWQVAVQPQPPDRRFPFF